jgi:hypothetical protein
MAASQPCTLYGNLNRVPFPSIIKGMESGGMIRCTQCGYKNSPVYHYCGVCGAVLQAPKEEAPAKPASVTTAPAAPVAAEPAPPPPAASTPAPPPRSERTDRADLPVSGGMSFLGLSESSSSSSPSYLLDDEEDGERSVAWGRIFFVLILLGAAGGLGWQWHRRAYPFAPRTPNQTAATSVAPATPAPAPTDTSAAPATPAPNTPAPAPATETPAPEASKPAEPATSTPTGPTESTPPAEKTESVPEKPAPVEKAEKVAPARPKTPPPAPEPAVSAGESLYIQGQRYLYGNGVTPNCNLALKSLLSAASRSNSKAQSTLGAMYSTGHCVTRDLPTAYRWFAKALHQDPNNSRLEQDLSVVWKQMTPGERQSATRSE